MWMRNVKQVKWSEDKQVSSRPYIFWLLISSALKKRHHELTARMHMACLWGQQLPCLHGQRCLASKARSAWDARRVPELQAVPMCHYCRVPGVFALSFSINRSFHTAYQNVKHIFSMFVNFRRLNTVEVAGLPKQVTLPVMVVSILLW